MAAATALACAGACVDHDPVTPSANTLIVHAVLDGGARQQVVIVQTTTGALLSVRTVAGAVVTLTLPDGRTVRATEVRDTLQFIGTYLAPGDPRAAYRFSLDAQGFELVPGGTYALRVVAPDGRVVTGHTTMPNAAAVPIVAPLQRFDVAHDTLALEWLRVAAARSYQVTVTSKFRPSGIAVFADTAVKLNGRTEDLNGNAFFVRGANHFVIVKAVDANYYDYYRRESDPLTGAGLISHLDGAEGVFGAMVELKVRILDVF